MEIAVTKTKPPSGRQRGKLIMVKNESKELQVVLPTEISVDSIPQLRNLPAAERIKTLQSITSYIGAETKNLDKWLGKEMPICGVLVHDATVAVEKVDHESGEIVRGYDPVKRTVFKLDGHEGTSAVSMAAESFANNFLIPAFGIGDWKDEEGNKIVVKVLVGQISKGDRRTFTFQVV